MTDLQGIKEKHREEIAKFIEDCPHTEVLIEDSTPGFGRRDITIRCKRCRLNLLTYVVDNSMSYLSYVRDCVRGHPHSRKGKKIEGAEITLQNAMNTLDAMQEDYEGDEYPDQENALRLGIEALKAVQQARLGILDLMPSVLPGETEEEK